jgi:hypothetical protein
MRAQPPSMNKSWYLACVTTLTLFGAGPTSPAELDCNRVCVWNDCKDADMLIHFKQQMDSQLDRADKLGLSDNADRNAKGQEEIRTKLRDSLRVIRTEQQKADEQRSAQFDSHGTLLIGQSSVLYVGTNVHSVQRTGDISCFTERGGLSSHRQPRFACVDLDRLLIVHDHGASEVRTGPFASDIYEAREHFDSLADFYGVFCQPEERKYRYKRLFGVIAIVAKQENIDVVSDHNRFHEQVTMHDLTAECLSILQKHR